MRRGITFPGILLSAFIIFWAVAATQPLDRFVWFLENIVVFISLPLVVLSYFKFRLSNTSYALIFVFAVLHVAASHYAYGNTPWGEWVSAQFGWERNHYDRIVHFLFGALILPVAGELFKNQLPKRRFAAGVFLFSFIFALGSLYEVAEFAAGVIVDPEAGLGFLGFQGDIWDTQKDMALQALGATMGLRFWRLRLRGPSASVK